MFLYVAFFKDADLERKSYFLAGNGLDSVMKAFPEFKSLNEAEIQGCIGFIKNKEFYDKNAYVLDIKNLKNDGKILSFDITAANELDVSNGFINKELYKLAKKKGWINQNAKYYPTVCLMDKTDFDGVRKGTPNSKKVSSNTAVIEEYKANNDWAAICKLYEPLENTHENSDLWNNADDLYSLAFACSKRGEVRNGQDREHLKEVKKYRDLSILFYKRCHDLEPSSHRYASAIAYRYYLNVMELTKPKGRRDGKAAEETEQALFWFDKALIINPGSIKDNYRKGKLILDKQIEKFKYSQNEWVRETFEELEKMEADGISSLMKALELYELLKEERRKNIYRNEYIKALYSLGCFYIEKPNLKWNEYVCHKICNQELEGSFLYEDLQYIADAEKLLEKCFTAETDMSLDDLNIKELTNMSEVWAVSPIDKLYRLGQVYLYMYYVKIIVKSDSNKKAEIYMKKAEKYLTTALNTSREMSRSRKGRRDDWFISEKLARFYIVTDQFNRAVEVSERARASYIINTCTIALLLSGLEENLIKAQEMLESAAGDKYNLAKSMSVVLLAYVYKKQGKQGDLDKIAIKEKEIFEGPGKKYLSILGI